ncbi:MAG: flagellar type III secretion system protein FliR [Rhizobiales bacterium]|nr:flagellar type III secretion system protein FliR [Hyphomicrobiales bacterium]
MNQYAETVVIAAFLSFCRVGACFMLVPGLSSIRVPIQIRLFTALAVSFALLATLWDQIVPFADRRPGILAPLIASELLIGGLMGLMTRFYILSLQFMGSAIAMLVGFGGTSGPGIEDGEVESAIGNLISFSALMLLFAFNFHHEVVRALVESYTVAPVGLAFKPQAALINLTDTLSDSFLLMLRIGSPFIAYAIIVNLTIGFVNKLTPQIPVYFISLPFVVTGGLFLLYFLIGTMLSFVADSFVPLTIGR